MISKELQYALTKCKSIPYEKGKARVYCVIRDRRGKIVSEAANSYTRTHPTMHRCSRKLGLVKDYLHAEVLAMLRAKGKGCKLYVARIDAKGSPVPAFPCVVCREAIRLEGSIKSIECTV